MADVIKDSSDQTALMRFLTRAFLVTNEILLEITLCGSFVFVQIFTIYYCLYNYLANVELDEAVMIFYVESRLDTL